MIISCVCFVHIVPAHTGGADLSRNMDADFNTGLVPAHTGGADLSSAMAEAVLDVSVPAHTGGADLSPFERLFPWQEFGPRPHGRGGFKLKSSDIEAECLCPRPHGRGGFKFAERSLCSGRNDVPAHTGGADLSNFTKPEDPAHRVPAHTGGADLSFLSDRFIRN